MIIAEFLRLVEILQNVQGINSGMQINNCDRIYKYIYQFDSFLPIINFLFIFLIQLFLYFDFMYALIPSISFLFILIGKMYESLTLLRQS